MSPSIKTYLVLFMTSLHLIKYRMNADYKYTISFGDLKDSSCWYFSLYLKDLVRSIQFIMFLVKFHVEGKHWYATY